MKYFAFILLISVALSSSGQGDSLLKFERRWGQHIADFSVDNFGNIYVQYENGQLKKINASGDSEGVFNLIKKYGRLYSIDVTNPLKLLLYYKDFGTILTLDRFMTVTNVIDLRKLNLFQVSSIGLSYDNNIWLFDELDGKIKKIDENGILLTESNDLRSTFDVLPSPDLIIDQDKLLYLYDTSKGVFIFDQYGALKNKLAFKGWNDFTVVAGTLYGRQNGKLIKYHPGSLHMDEISLPLNFHNGSRLRITSKKLYLLNGGIIEIYNIH